MKSSGHKAGYSQFLKMDLTWTSIYSFCIVNLNFLSSFFKFICIWSKIIKLLATQKTFLVTSNLMNALSMLYLYTKFGISTSI